MKRIKESRTLLDTIIRETGEEIVGLTSILVESETRRGRNGLKLIDDVKKLGQWPAGRTLCDDDDGDDDDGSLVLRCRLC